MLDPALQSSLNDVVMARSKKPQLTRRTAKISYYAMAFCIFMTALVAAATITTTTASHTYYTPPLTEEDMANLIVMVARKTGEIPVDALVALENSTGKKLKDLNASEQLEAIRFLMQRSQSTHNQTELAVW